ncbi:hypothetical protein [Ekhidna sp.]|uniref:hypothetical protein n=1 Tax=Ekhidna sp. TaxID=2608089 RepID=UPI0032975414
MSELLRFNGLSIAKDDFELKYNTKLTETEWKNLIHLASKSWSESVDELRLMAFRHIRKSMGQLGYKVDLEGKEVVFVSSE